ncbi:MAG: PhoH family protein [Spirochaetia bacterium]|nr:PhoH family protein [Spirochaetota bacterium]MCX8096972.1 PhoH family protein [Spirochaetota bacterium]MDW8111945.1 PhoH family protein [Spirochaetia bacterium]
MKTNISFPKGIDPLILSGVNDVNIKIIESNFKVKVYLTDNSFVVVGDEDSVKTVRKVINSMIDLATNDKIVSDDDMNIIIKQYKYHDPSKDIDLENIMLKGVVVSKKNKVVRPKTYGQSEYMKAIEENDIVFGIGPAGTGKTYLATAMALNYLHRNLVARIILTRPAVEAGENLGFLPGNLEEKVNPYLRPLYDSLFDMLGPEEYFTLMEKNVIEIAPLAFMRGRTLNNSFIILDEAQNTTKEQMKMFLTRLGFGSKMVITGDITQSDLPKNKHSGLIHAKKLFNGVEGIKIIYLGKQDVIRHELVKKIIELYENEEEL